jgi:hypothetical protein
MPEVFRNLPSGMSAESHQNALLNGEFISLAITKAVTNIDTGHINALQTANIFNMTNTP